MPSTSFIDRLRAQAAKRATSHCAEQDGCSGTADLPPHQRRRTGDSSQEYLPLPFDPQAFPAVRPPPLSTSSQSRPSMVPLAGASPNTPRRYTFRDVPSPAFGFPGPYMAPSPPRVVNKMGRKIWENMDQMNVGGDFAIENPEREFCQAVFDLQMVGMRASSAAYRMGFELQHAHASKSAAVGALEEVRSLLLYSNLKRAELKVSLEKSKAETSAVMAKAERVRVELERCQVALREKLAELEAFQSDWKDSTKLESALRSIGAYDALQREIMRMSLGWVEGKVRETHPGVDVSFLYTALEVEENASHNDADLAEPTLDKDASSRSGTPRSGEEVEAAMTAKAVSPIPSNVETNSAIAAPKISPTEEAMNKISPTQEAMNNMVAHSNDSLSDTRDSA